MSIRLKKQRQLVAALLKRDLTRVKTLSALRPLSPVSLDHALIGVEEWVAQLEGTLRGCFEDERVSVDVTERVNKTIANFRDPDELEPNPGPAYRSVIAQLLGVNGRVEKLIKDLGLYVEPKGLPPLRPLRPRESPTHRRERRPQPARYSSATAHSTRSLQGGWLAY